MQQRRMGLVTPKPSLNKFTAKALLGPAPCGWNALSVGTGRGATPRLVADWPNKTKRPVGIDNSSQPVGRANSSQAPPPVVGWGKRKRMVEEVEEEVQEEDNDDDD